MHIVLNILAIVLLGVMPFVRPCACGEFTLWCNCEAASREIEEPRAAPMCPKCLERDSRSQQQPQPQNELPGSERPCDAVHAIEGHSSTLTSGGIQPFTVALISTELPPMMVAETVPVSQVLRVPTRAPPNGLLVVDSVLFLI